LTFYSAAFANLGAVGGTMGTSTSGYSQYTTSEHIAPSGSAYARLLFQVAWDDFAGENDEIVDMDTFSFTVLGGGGTLYIVNTGFRFPYEWNTDGNITANRQFLEIQLTEYLHKHEEGV
jgi:hypothetical protein